MIGVLLWVFFALAGFYLASRYHKSSKELSATLGCIRLFSSGLRFEKASTETLLWRGVKEYGFDLPFLETVAGETGPLSHRIEKVLSGQPLSKNAASLWRDVGGILGQSDVTTQLSRLALLEQTGKGLLQEAKENEKTQGKLFRRAGVLLGALAFILTV